MVILPFRPVLAVARRARGFRIALVTIAVAVAAGCDDQTNTTDPGETPRQRGSLSVSLGLDSLPADGSSSTAVTSAITPPASVPLPSMTISTSAGALVGDAGAAASSVTAPISAAGMSTVTLVAPRTVGTGLITARFGAEAVATKTVAFYRAYPDVIAIDVPRFTIAANLDSALTLQIRVARVTGKPTEGAVVALSATQGGVFSGSTVTDANGELTVRFAVPAGASGDVTITAATRSSHADSTKVISSTAILRINP